jgi:glutathione S-transferase
MSAALKVYSIPGSPFLGSVLFTLEERMALYEFVPWQAGFMRTEAHLAMHPFGRMPVIEHEGFRLYETQAILRYIADAFAGEPLVPDDIRRCARMNQLIGIHDWYFFPKFASIAAWERVIKPRLTGQAADAAVVEAAMPIGRTCTAEAANLMGDGPYLTGGTLSLADLLWAPQIYYIATMPEGEELVGPHPALKSWLARMMKRPAMQRTMLFGIDG